MWWLLLLLFLPLLLFLQTCLLRHLRHTLPCLLLLLLLCTGLLQVQSCKLRVPGVMPLQFLQGAKGTCLSARPYLLVEASLCTGSHSAVVGTQAATQQAAKGGD
jgi:hypothetical protein